MSRECLRNELIEHISLHFLRKHIRTEPRLDHEALLHCGVARPREKEAPPLLP